MQYRFVNTPDPVYVATTEEAQKWAEYYGDRGDFGFDTETTGLDRVRDRIKFFSLADETTRICAPARLLEVFAPALEDPNVIKRMTNAKFDMHMAMNHGVHIRGPIYDTLVMDFLVDENRRGRHGLKQCAKDYLGLRMASFKNVFGSVGSVRQEVETLGLMHDALEENDQDLAMELLVSIRKADGAEEVLRTLQKIAMSKQAGYVLDARKLLALARKHDLAPKSAGKWSYVADFIYMLSGIELPKVRDRDPYVDLINSPDLIKEAHRLITESLWHQVDVDLDPLEMIELLVSDYASLDAWATYMLVGVYRDLLEAEYLDDDESCSFMDYYHSDRIDYTRTLWNMERRGFKIDLVGVDNLRRPMEKDINRLERNAVSMLGRDINLNSPKQLREAFYTQDRDGEWYDPFGGTPRKWTSGGTSGIKMPSTNKEMLKEWAERGDKLATIVTEHRVLTKLHGTYLGEMPNWVDHNDRVHTSLNESVAVTGRLSSNDPNLQNIPARNEYGKRIRKLFIAGFWGDASPIWCLPELSHIPVPDYPDDQEMILIVSDYAQLEMRIMAHFSDDPTMIQAIKEGKDLHCLTAALAGGYDYDEVKAAKDADDAHLSLTERQELLLKVRNDMKAVGFGLLYGIGAVKLGMQLGYEVAEVTSRRSGRTFFKCPEAEALIESYFNVFPNAKQFIEDTKAACREDLYVETLIGRKRRLPDIISSDKGMRAQAERQSVNSIIQGSAADITNEAMLLCERDETLRKIGVRMLLQIHDELVFECPNIPEVVAEAKARIQELMENPFDMEVPILISIDTAHCWGDAH